MTLRRSMPLVAGLLIAATPLIAWADPRSRGPVPPLSRLPREVRSYLDHLPPAKPGKARIAVFDHDKTLMKLDVGEQFMKWMLRKGYFPRQGGNLLKRAWSQRQQGKLDDLEVFKLAVSGMAGLKETRVKQLVDRYYRDGFGGFEKQIFATQKELVTELQERGVEVHIVSASNPWLIKESARRLGVPEKNVHAMGVKVDGQGRLTSELVMPLPWKDGKVDAIKAAGLLDRGAVIFASGDSTGDLRMLGLTKTTGGISMVVNAHETPRVAEAAAKNGWSRILLGADDTLSGAGNNRQPHRPAR